MKKLPIVSESLRGLCQHERKRDRRPGLQQQHCTVPNGQATSQRSASATRSDHTHAPTAPPRPIHICMHINIHHYYHHHTSTVSPVGTLNRPSGANRVGIFHGKSMHEPPPEPPPTPHNHTNLFRALSVLLFCRRRRPPRPPPPPRRRRRRRLPPPPPPLRRLQALHHLLTAH